MQDSVHCGDNQELDPYLWLEDVSSDDALLFVREQNEKSLHLIAKDSRFESTLTALRGIAFATDRIPELDSSEILSIIFGETKSVLEASGAERLSRSSIYLRVIPNGRLCSIWINLPQRNNVIGCGAARIVTEVAAVW